MKILIADDDPLSLEFIQMIVRGDGRELFTAETGYEVLRLFEENPDIDLILLDIRMPGINGYEVARLVRAVNHPVVIIAQTAYAMSGDRELALVAGCNDHIAKPICRTELVALIQTYFPGQMWQDVRAEKGEV